MNITLATYVVRNDSGTVDTDATVAKFSSDLDNYIAQRETEEASFLEAIDSVLESHKGVNINVPFVLNQALMALGVSEMPTTYKTMYDRAHAILSANAQGKTDKATGVAERPDSKYVIGKGKGGGLKIRADILVSDSE